MSLGAGKAVVSLEVLQSIEGLLGQNFIPLFILINNIVDLIIKNIRPNKNLN